MSRSLTHISLVYSSFPPISVLVLAKNMLKYFETRQPNVLEQKPEFAQIQQSKYTHWLLNSSTFLLFFHFNSEGCFSERFLDKFKGNNIAYQPAKSAYLYLQGPNVYRSKISICIHIVVQGITEATSCYVHHQPSPVTRQGYARLVPLNTTNQLFGVGDKRDWECLALIRIAAFSTLTLINRYGIRPLS